MKTITIVTHSDVEEVQDAFDDFDLPMDALEVKLILTVKTEQGVNPAARVLFLDDLNIIRVTVNGDDVLANDALDALNNNFDDSTIYMGDITFNMEAIL